MFTENETCQMKFLRPTNNKLTNKTSCKYVKEAIYLVLIIVPDVNEVADCVTFLHTGYTTHWHIHNVNNMWNWLLLNT